MGRRNLDRYTPADWKEAGHTVGAILANRWLVYTECELCERPCHPREGGGAPT